MADIVAVVGPITIVVLTMLIRLRRGHGRIGPWEVLRELARGRSATAAERECRATAVEVLDRLPGGGRLDMVDDRGHRRTYHVSPRSEENP
ncbi:hypothetical protein ACFWPU_11395 [Streptomyces sp. NPDC058471]|uniref:hypothetical protein n=1 Tax=Streptomyces sp. NPDC058471 TaxID=3346516 RepID=UPI00364FF1ED